MKFVVLFVMIFCHLSLISQTRKQIRDSINDNIVMVSPPDPQLARLAWEEVMYSTIVEKMRMSYVIPSNFQKDMTDTRECFDKYRKEMWVSFGCDFPSFISKDGEMLVFLKAYEFSIEGNQNYVSKEKILERGLLYMGENISKKWKDYVTHYPESEARRIFGADSVISYTINLIPKDYYIKKGKKYKYVDALFIQKKGRGYVYFYSFYTHKAKRNIELYRKQIETIVHYIDD